jgi:hypothetical protein
MKDWDAQLAEAALNVGLLAATMSFGVYARQNKQMVTSGSPDLPKMRSRRRGIPCLFRFPISDIFIIDIVEAWD